MSDLTQESFARLVEEFHRRTPRALCHPDDAVEVRARLDARGLVLVIETQAAMPRDRVLVVMDGQHYLLDLQDERAKRIH